MARMATILRWTSLILGAIGVVVAGILYATLNDQWVGITVLLAASVATFSGQLFSGERTSLDSVACVLEFNEADPQVHESIRTIRDEQGPEVAVEVLMSLYPGMTRHDSRDLVRHL